MILVTSNKTQSLLYLAFIGRVERAELQRGLGDLKLLLAELLPGFRVLVDLARLELMELDCATEVGLGMEMIDQSGVDKVVRVIPDPAKDIGMNVLSIFHYAHRPRIVTCENMSQAAKALSL